MRKGLIQLLAAFLFVMIIFSSISYIQLFAFDISETANTQTILNNYEIETVSIPLITDINIIESFGWIARSAGTELREVPYGGRFEVVRVGTAFRILAESEGWWKVETHPDDGSRIGWIRNAHAFINLPDAVPSLQIRNTNAGYGGGAIFTVNSAPLLGINGQTLYNENWVDPRGGFAMPIALSTAEMLASAQAAAQEYGGLIVYDAFRPKSAQTRVFFAMHVQFPSPGGWALPNFISPGISGHQLGVAVDVRLGDHPMPSNMHDLHPVSALFQRMQPSSGWNFSWNDNPPLSSLTALRSPAFNPTHDRFLPEAVRLQKIMSDAGFTSIASEWWHFDDRAGRIEAVNNGIAGTFDLLQPIWVNNKTQ